MKIDLVWAVKSSKKYIENGKRALSHIKTLIKHVFLLFYLHELLMNFWSNISFSDLDLKPYSLKIFEAKCLYTPHPHLTPTIPSSIFVNLFFQAIFSKIISFIAPGYWKLLRVFFYCSFALGRVRFATQTRLLSPPLPKYFLTNVI